MVSIRPRRQNTTKPIHGSWVNWDHPQAAGVKLCHLFNEGAGIPVDIARGYRVSPTGSPTWQPTTMGFSRGNYSTSNYDIIDPPIQVLGITYPWFVSVGLTNTNTILSQRVLTQRSLSAGVVGVSLLLNNGGAGIMTFQVSDNTAIFQTIGTTLPTNDGKYHTLACVARSTTSLEMWWDGSLVSSGSITSLGAMTATAYTLGVLRSTSITQPYFGQILWHMAGNGAAPDMAWLAREPYAAIQSPSFKRFFLPFG